MDFRKIRVTRDIHVAYVREKRKVQILTLFTHWLMDLSVGDRSVIGRSLGRRKSTSLLIIYFSRLVSRLVGKSVDR